MFGEGADPAVERLGLGILRDDGHQGDQGDGSDHRRDRCATTAAARMVRSMQSPHVSAAGVDNRRSPRRGGRGQVWNRPRRDDLS
jgi:hypothetical protein